VASYDVASNICPALEPGAAAGGVGAAVDEGYSSASGCVARNVGARARAEAAPAAVSASKRCSAA